MAISVTRKSIARGGTWPGSWVFDYQTVEQRAERLLELERWDLGLDEPISWPERIARRDAHASPSRRAASPPSRSPESRRIRPDSTAEVEAVDG